LLLRQYPAQEKSPQEILGAIVLFCDFFPLHGADIFLCLKAGGHNLMPAAQAPKTKIRAGAKYQPPFLSAGMGLFHNKDVI
jgi:hypothetical protein